MVFSLNVFVCFSAFLLVTNFYFYIIVIREDNWYDFNLLKLLVLCPNMYSLRKCFMCTWKECIFCCLGWNALKISIKSIWCSVSFKANVFLLIFSLEDLCIDENGLLKNSVLWLHYCQSLPLYPSIFALYI